MGALVLIPWPETSWSAAGRLAGRTSLPLTEQGCTQAQEWAEELAVAGIKVAFSCDDCTSVQTAKIVSQRCAARHKIENGLREVDSGLWGGLTTVELKRRFPKVFKKWYDDPTSVCPPDGEALADAFVRLEASLGRIRQKQGARNVAVVVGPLAFAVSRCVMESADLSKLRAIMHNQPLRYAMPTDSAGSQSTAIAAEKAGSEQEPLVESPHAATTGSDHGA